MMTLSQRLVDAGKRTDGKTVEIYRFQSVMYPPTDRSEGWRKLKDIRKGSLEVSWSPPFVDCNVVRAWQSAPRRDGRPADVPAQQWGYWETVLLVAFYRLSPSAFTSTAR